MKDFIEVNQVVNVYDEVAPLLINVMHIHRVFEEERPKKVDKICTLKIGD